MELSQLRDNPTTETFDDGGEGFTVTFNRNAFTPEFLRNAANQIRKLAETVHKAEAPKRRGKKQAEQPDPLTESEITARSMEFNATFQEIEREVYADILAKHVLSAWSITDDGEPVVPSKEVLVTLHPRTVRGLWEFCFEKSSTVKKQQTQTTTESPMTSETTQKSSFGVDRLGENQTM